MSDVAFCQITLALVNKQSVASTYESSLHILGLLKEYSIYQTAKQLLCRKYYRWDDMSTVNAEKKLPFL